MEDYKLLKSLSSLYVDLLELDAELELDSMKLNKAAHYWKDKDPVKYKKMLAKLKNDRKKSGHKEEAAQKVQQARRRERGGKGTTSGQHGRKGHKDGHSDTSTGAAVKKLQNAQKKSGQRLSMDRKNNEHGYKSSNVRYVPDRLNNGDENRADKKKWVKNHNKKK